MPGSSGLVGKLVFLWLTFILFSAVKCEKSLPCLSSEFRCHTSGKCIPMSWQCDGGNDCGDGSDEQDCKPKTCSTDEYQCHNARCIPKRWVCDGQNDCTDGSDELSNRCTNRTCSNDTFTCGDGGCIPKAWKCDGQKDCNNGKDEEKCKAQTCTSNQFACKNGDCIVSRWRCDGDADCSDESDEQECEPSTCAPSEFRCGTNTTVCIPGRWKCDGDNDCPDKSDENNCKKVVSACPPQDFMCQTSKECIHKAWRCDGEPDCGDKSDETGCANTCRPDQFHCGSNECIHHVLYCNGQKDCHDGSDEVGCKTNAKHECNKLTEFDCMKNGQKCISLNLVCDSKQDCAQGEDEGVAMCSQINPCSVKNGNCTQKCKNTHTSDICFCDPGFYLAEDKRRCIDIDECKNFGTCAQRCTNIPGSFHCSCDQPGYIVDHMDHRNCKAVGSAHPYLIFADRHVIRKLDPNSGRTAVVVKQTDSAIAMDYHWEQKLVFWSDTANEKVYSANLVDLNRGKMPERKDWRIVAQNVSTPDGIAVDWIHHLIFWTDTGKNTIEVAKLDGTMRTRLLYKDLDEPRDIVVDPIRKFIYWTDWAEDHPRIEKCGINGDGRKKIITKDIQWPNGLTIDLVTQRLYWVDAKMHMISSSDLDGNQQRTILRSHTALEHPFSIAVFENRVYWSDWEHNAIKSVDKFTGNNSRNIAVHLYGPMDVHVLHPFKQPKGENVCEHGNGGCSHLCLPAPIIGAMSPKFTCHCPIDFQMLSDGRSCGSIAVKHTTSSVANPGRAVSRNNTVNYTHAVTPVPNGPISASNASNSRSSDLPEDFGRVAGIVIGVVLVVLIVVFIVGFILYRQYTRRNVKSMNFDNPVYRKTTEEQVNLDKGQFQPSIPSTLQPLNQTLPDLEV